MSLSKRIRFEVLKRDGFRCGYCGKTPPSVLLEVDHINPKANGGIDDINNCITSCFDCNRGKSSIRLEQIPSQVQENLEILKEKRKQAKAYERLVKKIRLDEDKKIEEIGAIYTNAYGKWILSDNFKDVSVRKFIRSIPFEEVKRAMVIACSKEHLNRDSCVKYFCGICWKIIKGDFNG